MKRIFCLALCVVLVFSVSAAAIASGDVSELYVSVDGSDLNPGTLDAPLATLEGAKEKLKAMPYNPAGYVVYFRGGTYFIDSTVRFDSSDRQNTVFKAYNGEAVRLSGARELRGFTRSTVNGVSCWTKQLGQNERFRSLFNSGEQLSTPRYPESGFLFVKSVDAADNLYTEETTPWSLTLGNTSFNGSPDDLPDSFTNVNDVVVRILHYWKDEMMFVTKHEPLTGKIGLSRPSTMIIREGDRYFLDNVFEALDSPGEWYLNTASSMLYYIPREGESIDTAVLYAGNTEMLLNIDGAEGITFKNLVFTQTEWNLPVTDSTQAAIDVRGAVEVSNSSDIAFVGCRFTNIGNSALKFYGGIVDSSVRDCEFDFIGATAVFVGGDNVAVDSSEATRDIAVENNHIYRYGRRFFNAIGVHLTYARNVSISNNEIHDGFYSGISCGWNWTYSHHLTRDISICNNLIYDIGQGFLSDMGGIYTLGVQRGTVLSGNIIHNVAADPGKGGYGGWGIYLDQSSSFITVTKNLLYDCYSQGLNIHYGMSNLITNNISAFNGEGQVCPGSRGEEHETAHYSSNIFLTDDKPIYVHLQNPGHFSDDRNLAWDINKGARVYACEGDDKLSVRKASEEYGCFNNAVLADPLFVDAENRDFTLSAQSPALLCGFEPWDFTEAGTSYGTKIGIGDGLKQRLRLTVNQEGSFRVMAVAESADIPNSKKALTELVKAGIEAKSPDLIVYMGNNVLESVCSTGIDLLDRARYRTVISAIVSPAVKAGIPFAVLFGLREYTNRSGVSLEEQMEIWRSFDGCVAVNTFSAAEEWRGAYTLGVEDGEGRSLYNLFFLAGMSYRSGKWLASASENLNADSAKNVIFQSIPCFEINSAIPGICRWDETAPFVSEVFDTASSSSDTAALVSASQYSTGFGVGSLEGVKFISCANSGFLNAKTDNPGLTFINLGADGTVSASEASYSDLLGEKADESNFSGYNGLRDEPLGVMKMIPHLFSEMFRPLLTQIRVLLSQLR